jgi:zeaxanthin glucosyltransferase
MRIAFVALSAPGHLNPTTCWRANSSRVTTRWWSFLCSDAEPYVSAARFAFIPYCEAAFSTGAADEIRRQMSELQGEDWVRFMIEAQGQMMGAALSSLPAALATARAEAVVLDTSQYYVEMIPMSLGLPYVV